MAYWNGEKWAAEDRGSASRQSRRATWAATAVMCLGFSALIVPLAGASAGRGYSGSLTATPDTVRAGDYFTVRGCGYDRSLGNVIVGFAGGSWGSALDARGCFSIPDIPALSGDTLPAGTYEVRAFQLVRKRWVETGDTYVTVVP